MAQNSFIQNAIDCEAIKIRPTSTIITAFLVMPSRQKLCYVNNTSLCEVCFLKLKFPWAENFLSW